MGRLVVQPYGISKSAKVLAEYLEIQRLKVTNSRFRGRATDIIINWGIPKKVHQASTYVNPLAAVHAASNKLTTFKLLKEANVSIPVFDTNCSFADDSSIVVARTVLSGHSGKGIVIGEPNELPSAPLYTEYIEKTAEYRAIVCAGETVDFKQKLKRRAKSEDNPDGFEGEHDKHVWNLDGGYIFARNGIRHPETADQLAVDAVKALGLTYGAVDIIENEEGTLYVLEVNTAFGIEGETLSLFGDKLKAHIEQMSV